MLKSATQIVMNLGHVRMHPKNKSGTSKIHQDLSFGISKDFIEATIMIQFLNLENGGFRLQSKFTWMLTEQ